MDRSILPIMWLRSLVHLWRAHDGMAFGWKVAPIMNDYQHRIERVMQKAFEKPWKLIDKRTNEFAYEVPNGLSYKDIEGQIDALYSTCGAVVELKDYAGVVVIKVNPDDFPEEIPYQESMLTLTKGRSVVLGFDRSGKAISHNFRVPHLLMAGQSGYGKTDLLRWILFQLVTRFTPDELQINIIDMKGFSFLPFRDVPHVKVVRDLAGAHSVLKEGKRIMDERSNIVWNSNNRSQTQNFKWHLIVIDEASQISPLLIRDKEKRMMALECDEYAASISAIGREASVGLFYCTQRPDATVINPLVKANMDAVFCFRTKTELNSMIVLDRPGAEKLPHGKAGRGFYLTDELTEIQVPYIGKDDKWHDLLKPYQKEIEIHVNDSEGTKENDGDSNVEGFTDCLNESSGNLFQGIGVTSETGIGNYAIFGEGKNGRGEKARDRQAKSVAADLVWTFPVKCEKTSPSVKFPKD